MSHLPKAFTMPLRRDGLDPLPALGALRQSDPVHRFRRVFGLQVWLVTGYDEARAVLAESHRYSTDVRSLMGQGMDGAIGGLGFTDPPDHTRLRALLTPEFTGRRLAAMQPTIERIIAGRLDALAAADGDVVDLMAEFAFPIPFLVICELLGLSVSDQEQFRRIGSARFDVDGGGATAFGAMSQSREFLLQAVQQQRTAPGDGLIGQLIREHGDAVTDVELAGLADGVFTGGYETSASMLGLGLVALLRDPKAARQIREDDDAVPRVVEELLRYLSVVQIPFPRFAREDMTLFGQDVAAGDAVVCSLSAANRDGAFGSEPEAFDPDRAAASHLAFGHGIHRCVGAELARLELRAAFPALLRRFPDLQLALSPDALEYTQTSIVYGLRSLPVRLGADAYERTRG
jgi:cytochrome P450